MTKSTRVQMSQETKNELEKLAVIYGCLYDEQPSISKLLAEIGSKKLTIQSVESNIQNNELPLLLISMTTPFNVNGIVATITRIIAKYKAKIFKTEAEQKQGTENLGVLKIYLSLPSENNMELFKILVDISKITFKDLKDKFENEDSQFLGAHKALVSKENTRY